MTRLRRFAPAIVQSAVAAALAWLVATELLGHETPFFAPTAAIVVLSVAMTDRTGRAVELMIGVTVGVLIADVILVVIGSGAWQIAVVVVLAMSAAVLLGGSPFAVRQAATSAVLVTTIQVPGELNFERPIDAFVGAAVALIVYLVLIPPNPRRLLARDIAPFTVQAATATRGVAAALRSGDENRAIEALVAARELTPGAASLHDATEIAIEAARWSPWHRAARGELDRLKQAVHFLEVAMRNLRVLARGSLRAVETRAHVPERELAALEDLARAFDAMPDGLRESPSAAAREHALAAAVAATEALADTANLAVSHLTAQVRAIATDLLRALGEEGPQARAAVRDAAGEGPGRG